MTFAPPSARTRPRTLAARSWPILVVSAVALAMGSAAPAAGQSTPYTDVSGGHADAIAAITDAGIAEGCAPDRYCPDDDVRRDQMASFIAAALELDRVEGDRFADVAADNPHAAAINALADAGITTGCADDLYCPDESVTRSQMATFLATAMELAPAEMEYFHDVGEPHADAAQRLGEAGISGGCDTLGLEFCPDQDVRRDQMASFLARALGLTDPVGIPVLLEPGDEGAHVRALQRRLAASDYWIGPIDGVYGELTEQAVLAIQKVHGLSRDGIYGPSTRRVVARPVPPTTESSSGYVVEFDEDRQIVMLVDDGTAETILHASGGNETYYTYDGTQYYAETPNGSWRVYRQIDGWRTSHLGELYRPKYFHTDGIAFHGYPSVPARAASHGCVRVSMEAMDWLWATDALPIGTDVLVYGSPG